MASPTDHEDGAPGSPLARGPRRFHGLLLALVVLACAARFLHVSADFPAISGSLGEYADAGEHFAAVHSFVLTGTWPEDQVGVLFFGPISHVAAWISVKALGCTPWGWRLPSLLASLGAIALAGASLRGPRALSSRGASPALLAMLLLATDPIWLAYARCEKQEVLGALFLFASCLSAATSRQHPGAAGFRAASWGLLAILVKPTFGIPVVAVLGTAFAESRSRNFLTGLLAGSAAALLVSFVALGLLVGRVPDAALVRAGLNWHNTQGLTWPSPLRSLELLWSSNIAWRSPLHLLGLFLAARALFNWRQASLPARIASVAFAGILIFPFFVAYFPLRFRVPTLPLAAWLVGDALCGAPNRESDLARAEQAPAWRSWRFPLACTLAFPCGRLGALLGAGQAWAILAGAAAGIGLAFLPRPRRLANLPGITTPHGRRTGVLPALTAASILLSSALTIALIAGDRFDLVRIATRVTETLPAGTTVGTNWRWGQQVLLYTRHPGTRRGNAPVRAFLGVSEKDGSTWGTAPPRPLATIVPAWTQAVWFGPTYSLLAADTSCQAPELPAML